MRLPILTSHFKSVIIIIVVIITVIMVSLFVPSMHFFYNDTGDAYALFYPRYM